MDWGWIKWGFCGVAYAIAYSLPNVLPEENPKTVRLNGGEFVQLSLASFRMEIV